MERNPEERAPHSSDNEARNNRIMIIVLVSFAGLIVALILSRLLLF